MIVGAVVFGTSPVLAQEGASEQPLANETQLSGESSTLTDTEKSQPSSETELSGNKQEQERKDKQEEKITKRLLCTRFGKCRNSDRKRRC